MMLFTYRKRLKDAMKIRTPDMRRILSDIFKYIQTTWLEKGSSSRVGSTSSKGVRVKEKRKERNSQQILVKPTRTVTPEEMRIRADLSCLTKIYHRHLLNTPVKKTAFSLVRKLPTVFSTTLSDEMFANNVLDEICDCDEINVNDQDFAADIPVEAVDKIGDPSLSTNSNIMKNSRLQEVTINHLLVPVIPMTNAELRDSNICQHSPVISDSNNSYLMLGAKCKSLSSAVPLSSLFMIPILKQKFSLYPEQTRSLNPSAISFETESDAQLQNAHQVFVVFYVYKICSFCNEVFLNSIA